MWPQQLNYLGNYSGNQQSQVQPQVAPPTAPTDQYGNVMAGNGFGAPQSHGGGGNGLFGTGQSTVGGALSAAAGLGGQSIGGALASGALKF